MLNTLNTCFALSSTRNMAPSWILKPFPHDSVLVLSFDQSRSAQDLSALRYKGCTGCAQKLHLYPHLPNSPSLESFIMRLPSSSSLLLATLAISSSSSSLSALAAPTGECPEDSPSPAPIPPRGNDTMAQSNSASAIVFVPSPSLTLSQVICKVGIPWTTFIQSSTKSFTTHSTS